jgi:hypothetical protein
MRVQGGVKQVAEREGFAAALILKAFGISLRKFNWLDGKSKAENGSRSGSRYALAVVAKT